MNSTVTRLSRAVWPPVLVAVVHLVLLLVLAQVDTVRELLATANPSIPLALLLSGFYVLRLLTLFVVPGWLVARVVHAFTDPRTHVART